MSINKQKIMQYGYSKQTTDKTAANFPRTVDPNKLTPVSDHALNNEITKKS